MALDGAVAEAIHLALAIGGQTPSVFGEPVRELVTQVADMGTAASRLSRLSKQVDQYLSNQPGDYGVAIIDLATGIQVGPRSGKTYYLASTWKIPLIMTVFEQVNAGKLRLNDVVKITREDYEDGTGTLQQQRAGTSYSVRELVRRSIVESDNTAANMLARAVGGRSTVHAYQRSLGAKEPVRNGDNLGTPAEVANYLWQALTSSRFTDEQRGLLRQSLGQTIWSDRIPAYLPPGTPVGHKIGTLNGVVNDVGVVYGSRPFIIAVLSEGVEEQQGAEVIARVAKLVFDSQTQQPAP